MWGENISGVQDNYLLIVNCNKQFCKTHGTILLKLMSMYFAACNAVIAPCPTWDWVEILYQRKGICAKFKSCKFYAGF